MPKMELGFLNELEHANLTVTPLHVRRPRRFNAATTARDTNQDQPSTSADMPDSPIISTEQISTLSASDGLMTDLSASAELIPGCSSLPDEVLSSPAAFVNCAESSGTSTPHSLLGRRKRAGPSSTPTKRRAKRRLPYDDVELMLGGPSTSGMELRDLEPTPGPSRRDIFTPSSSTRARVEPPLRRTTENLRDEDTEGWLYSYGSEGSDESDDDNENTVLVLNREEAVFRYCEAEEQELAHGIDPLGPASSPRPHIVDASPAVEPKLEPELSPSVTQPASVSEPQSSSQEPLDKFKFEWKTFPSPPISPNSRREKFSQINCGPTASYRTPYDAFTAIWDKGIMEHIATETNRYVHQQTDQMRANNILRPASRINRWKDTSVNELYVFFAIIITMGGVVKNCIKDYWQKAHNTYSTPGFAAVMSLDRFLMLSRYIHFNNNAFCTPEIMGNSEAKFFKLKPIVNHLNDKFAKLYRLSQNLALDESLTMWKGLLNINQFIRNKASAVGIKTYEICESQTGYTWRLKIHTGQDHRCPERATPVSGAIPSIVLDLVKGLEGKGHTLWMDNYYNSPALARELKSLGFDCVGTLRTNRQFVPVELANLQKQDMVVGKVYGCTSGDVDLLVWRDKTRVVALISTFHGARSTMCHGTLKPSIVGDYNICMGGVDTRDASLASYPIERKRGRVWYKKFFKRLLNISILNAYILYKASSPITQRNFRMKLTDQLLERHSPPRPAIVGPTPPVGHYPVLLDFMAGNKKQRLRRSCAQCKQRTITQCIGCNKAMCIGECFRLRHNL